MGSEMVMGIHGYGHVKVADHEASNESETLYHMYVPLMLNWASSLSRNP